jgi:branched-chain amino acid transport system ATP-binding protein
LLDGQDITHATPEAICHAGIARTFQLNACFDSLTARENVQVGAVFGRASRGLPGLKPSAEAQAATEEALVLVGLADKADAVAGALPVLDRKLLMLAGAMATRPKLLLMDEPVGGLTSAETDLMMETVRRIKAKGVTIILIEHVMRFLVALSDRIMILHHGERIYEGLAAGLVRDKTVVDVYLGEGASARLAALLHEPAP